MSASCIPPDGSQEFEESFSVLKDLGDHGLAIVPTEPTADMLAAGVRAAGIDPSAARKLYLAMLAMAP